MSFRDLFLSTISVHSLTSASYRPDNMTIYQSVFRFLAQMRRAQHLTTLISPINSTSSIQLAPLLRKQFYVLRMRLAWIIGVLYEFMMQNVLETELKSFKESTGQMSSLEELIMSHSLHVTKLRDRLLLSDAVSHFPFLPAAIPS